MAAHLTVERFHSRNDARSESQRQIDIDFHFLE